MPCCTMEEMQNWHSCGRSKGRQRFLHHADIQQHFLHHTNIQQHLTSSFVCLPCERASPSLLLPKLAPIFGSPCWDYRCLPLYVASTILEEFFYIWICPGQYQSYLWGVLKSIPFWSQKMCWTIKGPVFTTGPFNKPITNAAVNQG